MTPKQQCKVLREVITSLNAQKKKLLKAREQLPKAEIGANISNVKAYKRIEEAKNEIDNSINFIRETHNIGA